MLKRIFNRRNTDSLTDSLVSDNGITIIRKPIKHLYLRIHTDGQVVVSAPKQMPMKTISAFIDSKQHWIATKKRQQQERAERKKLSHTDNLNELMLFGEKYPITYRSGQGVRKNHIELQGQEAICYLRSNNVKPSVEKLINQFYRQQLQTVLNEQVYRYESVIGVSVNEIRIKQMKTKWGTCNIPNKRLWFNLRLANLPIKCSEYVVVHEMTHLLERYHNRRFYQLVEKAMPDWEVWHRYLKKL